MAVTRVEGHFGEWLQGCLGPNGPVVLVTLACPALWVEAGPDLSAPMCHEATQALRAALGAEGLGIATNMIPGAGHGFSTAALVALARAQGRHEDSLPELCRTVEGASDPIMLRHPDRVLWASRLGLALRPLPAPPAADILGFHVGPVHRTDAADARFPDIADLVERWSAGPDLSEAARLASLSAARTTALRGPEADPTADLARDLGALGHARAHTGNARALIFAPGAVPPRAADDLQRAGFGPVISFRTGS